MKKMKKLFAAILSLAMVLGMCMVTSAAPEGSKKPEAKDHKTATVSNVEKGANVIAYRIVEPQYNDNGFYGFKRAEGLTESDLKDPLKPESNEVTKIAQRLMDTENPLKGLLSNNGLKNIPGIDITGNNDFVAGEANEAGLATFSAELTPGYWVVIVTGSEIQEVYNPMLVGVYYDTTGSGSNSVVQTDLVDANKSWTLAGTPAYAKSQQPTIDKSITTKDTNTDSSANKGSGNDVAIGDTVSFLIDTQIPSYSQSYKEVSVKIKDKMGQGLVLADEPNFVVKVNGNADANIVPEKNPETNAINYTITTDTDNKGFVVEFASTYALSHSGQEVHVSYDAVLTESAVYNFNANVNKATLEYTNDPTGETNEIDDRTYTYTFGIDASVNGLSSDITKEVWKTGSRIVEGETEKFGLNDAIFALKNNETGAIYYTQSGKGEVVLDKDGNATPKDKGFQYPTDANGKYDGYLAFTGLDAGKYTLQEIKAPDGWSLNNAEIPVEVKAVYNEDGTLKSYTITVNGKVIDGEDKGSVKDSNYVVGEYQKDSATGDQIPVEVIENPESNTQEIPNTQLSALPSTGGIGTTIFTIGGCVIMIVAAGLFFASRRKSSAK